MTAGDRRRIEAHTGLRPWSARVPSDPEYADFGDDPVWPRAFDAAGARPVLDRRDNGDCVFLGAAGCTLPLEVRPLVCRLYPYAFDHRGVVGVCADRCPAAVVPPGATILSVLGMEDAPAEAWRAQLYREILEEPER